MDPKKTLEQQAFDVKHANEMELATRELMRKSHDLIRIYNPLDHTFSFMYDRFWHRVPAKSYKDIERYLALKFFKNICDYMIGQQVQTKGEELKALREKQMGQQFLDHYEENVQVWDRVPKMNDPDLIEAIKKTVIIGVVEEYGMQVEEVLEQVPEPMTDYRPVHEQMFDNLTPVSLEPVSNDTPLPVSLEELQGIQEPTVEKKVNIKKEDLEKEVINEDKK